MKKLLIFIFALIVNLGSSCDPNKDRGWHNCITIKNNTNNGIYYCKFYTQDSLFIPDYNPSFNKNAYYASANSSNGLCQRPRDYYELSFNSHKTLYLYVFDATAVEQNWDSVRTNRLLLHLYKLTLEDLERMNWVVDYPPY